MKHTFTFLIISGLLSLSSCTSVYKNTQMPDDLYYAPTTTEVKEKEEEKKEEEKVKEREDNFIRLKVQNPTRWSTIDDYTYWNDVRFNHCNCYCNNNSINWNNNVWSNNYQNQYWYNNFNNPYTLFIPYVAPTIVKNTSSFSPIKSFNNNTTNNTNFVFNPKFQTQQTTGSTGNNGVKTKSTAGTIIRLFGGGNSSSTTTPSSNAGGQSGGFKSTGTSSSTPRKGRG